MPDNYETEEQKRQRLLREQAAKQTVGQTIGYPGSTGVPEVGLFDKIKKLVGK